MATPVTAKRAPGGPDTAVQRTVPRPVPAAMERVFQGREKYRRFQGKALQSMEFPARFTEFVIVLAQEHDFLPVPMMAGPLHTQMRKGRE
ncbi:MAG: hypothetical protein J7530_00725 [Novosphingobium sp.]|nr:hypothetical protein [Novosphingobium sp.]